MCKKRIQLLLCNIHLENSLATHLVHISSQMILEIILGPICYPMPNLWLLPIITIMQLQQICISARSRFSVNSFQSRMSMVYWSHWIVSMVKQLKSMTVTLSRRDSDIPLALRLVLLSIHLYKARYWLSSDVKHSMKHICSMDSIVVYKQNHQNERAPTSNEPSRLNITISATTRTTDSVNLFTGIHSLTAKLIRCIHAHLGSTKCHWDKMII